MTQSEKTTIYIFDTSAFAALQRQHMQVLEMPQTIWDWLGKMITGGRIISHRFVYDEVVSEKAEKPDMITDWLLPRKSCFMKESADQALVVADVMDQFPKLIDSGREKEQADPWIIAQAIVLGQQTSLLDEREYVVVTQESQISSKKIPAACRHFKVRAVTLRQFFEENGVSIETVNVSAVN